MVVVAAVTVGAAEVESIEALEQRLETATGAQRLELLNELAYSTSFRSVEVGTRYGEQALALATELGDRLGEAKALRNLAVAKSVAGDHRGSIDLAKRSLVIFEDLGEHRLTAVALNTIGVCHRMLNEYDQALQHYQRSLEIDREIGNDTGVSRTLSNVGNVHYDRGDFQKALEVHLEALAIETKIDDLPGVAGSHNNLGITLYRLGRYDEALEHLIASLNIQEELGNLSAVAGSATNIGNIFQEMKQLDRALHYFQRAVEVQTDVGNLNGLCSATMNTGNVYQLLERFDDAYAQYEKALDLARRTDSPATIASALDNMGTVHRRREDFAAALPLHRQALEIREGIGVQHQIATSAQNIGMAMIGLGRLDEAQPYLERALDLSRASGALAQVVEMLADLSDLHEAAGDLGRALHYRKAAADAREELLNESTNQLIAELETRYQAEARKREIELLEKENQIQRLAASRARLRANLILGGLGLALFLMAWLIHRYRSLFAFWKRRSYVGHYKIVERIATGGMGVVYHAQDVISGSRAFALKVIRDEHAADETVRRRFLHEAALVDQLDSPHIVRVHERGEHEGRLFMAMELLEGQPLADLIGHDERIAVETCLHIMAQLAEVVARIHEKEIVHRDLKPENVMLVEHDGDPFFVKLLDFGLARTQSLTRLTETGMIVGTIAYLAPEQISHQQATTASDVYSLGVVFYQVLTGEVPFPGDTPVEIIRQILESEALPPASFRPAIGADLDALVLAMISKEPSRRPCASAVVEALGNLQQMGSQSRPG